MLKPENASQPAFISHEGRKSRQLQFQCRNGINTITRYKTDRNGFIFTCKVIVQPGFIFTCKVIVHSRNALMVILGMEVISMCSSKSHSLFD